MPLSASTCLQGVYCVVNVEEVTPGDAVNEDRSLPRRAATCTAIVNQGFAMSNSDPSEFELHMKARSLGLLLPQEGSIVSGLNFRVSTPNKGLQTVQTTAAEENTDRHLRYSLPGISAANNGEVNGNNQRNHMLPRPVALPKIPSIKHPYERGPPQIMQRGGATYDQPLSLTSLLMTPRSKTILGPSSSFIGSKPKPDSTPGNRWATHPGGANRLAARHPDPGLNNTARLVISPKSKADLRHSPRDYYRRKFPHVRLTHESTNNLQAGTGTQRNRLPGSKHVPSHGGFSSDTIKTKSELFALTRSKTDLMAVEQLITRSSERVSSTRSWAVSGWLDGMTCNPKKLHTRDLSDCVT